MAVKLVSASDGARTEPSSKRVEFLDALQRELLKRDPAGTFLDAVDDPSLLASTTADRIIDTSRIWEEHIGPFYDVDGVRELLGRGRGKLVTRQAVSKRKGLLALTTGSGHVVYPAFQFEDSTTTVGVSAVMKALPAKTVSPWMVASWLVSNEADLDGSRPIDVIKEGGLERVLVVAKHWAGALAQ